MEGHQEQQFKSTDIHASKAGAKVNYFKQTDQSSTNKKHKFKILDKRIKLFGKQIPVILIAAIIAIIAIIVGIIIICINSNKNPSGNQTSGSDSEVAELTEYDEVEVDSNAPKSLDDQAAETLKSSGLAAFLSQYQSALNSAQSDEDRASIYLNRSSNSCSQYLQDGNEEYKNQAIQDALTAEKIFASAASANSLATIYYAIDDNQSGDQFYALYEERLATESPANSDEESSSEPDNGESE